MQGKADLVPRFSVSQRIAHWSFTFTFVALLITGLFLMVPSLSGLAAGGLSTWVHRISAVIFMATPVYYMLFDWKGLKRLMADSFTYDRDDLRWLARFPVYLFGKAKGMPPQGRINAGEKLHHAVIILLFFSISITGLFLWLGKETLGATAFNWMLIAHDVTMTLMTLLTIGHIYFVFVYGALGGMTTGSVTRAYAKLEHAKWLAEVEANERRQSA